MSQAEYNLLRNIEFGQDPAITRAIQQIKADYGDDVSVTRKAKLLRKFGRTSNAADVTVSGFWDSVLAVVV